MFFIFWIDLFLRSTFVNRSAQFLLTSVSFRNMQIHSDILKVKLNFPRRDHTVLLTENFVTLTGCLKRSGLDQKLAHISQTRLGTEKLKVPMESPQNSASHEPVCKVIDYCSLDESRDLFGIFDMSGVQLSFHEGNVSMLQIINSGP